MDAIGGEFDLIAKITHPFCDHQVIKGVGDDCAVIKTSKGSVLLVTTDSIISLTCHESNFP